MQKKLALLLAALLMTVSVQTAWANDDDDADDAPDITLQQDGDEDAGFGHPFRLGHPGHWRGRGHGPQMMPGMRGMGRGMMGRGGDKNFGGFFGMRMMHGVELTDAQKNQFIDTMVDSYRKNLVLRMEQHELFQKLVKEHESDTPNHDAIIALNKALGEVTGRIDVAKREYAQKTQNILTPEQKDQIKEKMEKMRENWEKRREERGPGKGPRLMRGPGPRMMQ